MVGVPGKFKGCETCRNRRVKCDNQRPKCKKCQDSGRDCAGYQRDIVFIMATQDDAGRCSSHPPRRISTPSTTSRAKRTATPESPRLHLTSVEPLRPAWEESVLLSNNGDLCQFRVAVLHTNLRDIHRDTAGGENGQWKLILPAFAPQQTRLVSFYSDLNVSSQAIVHVDSSRSTFTSNTILFLSEHTGIVPPTTGMSLSGPTMLASRVESQGPEAFRQFPGHHYFVRVYRHTAAMLSLLSRRPTFLASDEWRSTPWTLHGKSQLDRLVDTIVLIPDLFQRADGLVAVPADLTRRQCAQVLLSECLFIETQLDDWHLRLQSSNTPTTTGAYWAPDPTSPSTLLKGLQVPFSDMLFFKDGATALCLLTYWTAMLLLHTAIDQVHCAVCDPILDDYPNLYADLPIELQIDVRRYRQRREYASRICRGLDFALSAGVQLDTLVVPLAVASSVFKEINEISSDAQLEVQWCEGFEEALTEQGQALTREYMGTKWSDLANF